MKEKLSLTRDGLALYGLLEGPDLKAESSAEDDGASASSKMPLAIIMHGFNTSSRQTPFYDLTRALWAEGIATLRFDFSCHGRSEGDMAEMTVPGLMADAETFYAYAKSLDFVSEIYLIGYSLGGIVASHLAVNHQDDVHKLVLLSPAADIHMRATSGFFFGNLYDPADPPELMETEMFRIGRPYFLSAQEVVVYEHLKDFDGDALIVYGKADEYVPEEMTLDYKNVIRNLKIVPVPEAGHLWQVNSDIAVKEIADFLR